jgi:hypothetical protein
MVLTSRQSLRAARFDWRLAVLDSVSAASEQQLQMKEVPAYPVTKRYS